MRQNPDARNVERKMDTALKRKARLNPHYRHHELELIRQKRSHSAYKEKERVKKSHSRASKRLQNQEMIQKMIHDFSRQVCETRSQTESEQSVSSRQKFGTHIEECIQIFHKKIAVGPIYVCTCCHQTWFEHSVSEVTANKLICISDELKHKCFTARRSVNGKEWLCNTCLQSLRHNKIPRLCHINGLGFPDKPPELNLHPLEERLISLRIPFMTLYELPRGSQYQLHGSVVNVPVDIAPTVKSLPRLHDSAATIPIKLKRKRTYKTCVLQQNVRPVAVLCALHYLMTKSLYKNANINIDEGWLASVTESQRHESEENNNIDCNGDDSDNSDTFSEVDQNENVPGNLDTMLDDENIDRFQSLTFAPGEGQSPLSLFQDKDAEVLSFPAVFCGERRKCDEQDATIKLHYSEICKWELRAEDRRVASNVPNLFFKAKKLQIKQVADKGTLVMKRVQSKGKEYTAGEMLNENTQNNITKLDEGYRIFRTIRNSPPYLEQCRKDIMAMIRQLGLPTWFMSLSAADSKWHDLLVMLGKLIDKKDYTDDLVDNKLSWRDVTRLVSSDPVTCARYFNDRVQQFIEMVLKSPHCPIGELKDYVYRVEFQHRGSPHIHMLVWVKDSPLYDTADNEEIENYVDTYISCSDDQPEEQTDLLNMQKHKHSRSCRKKGQALCRFGFPIPPMSKTTLLSPFEEPERDDYENLYKKIKEQLDEMKDGCDISFEQFLQNLNCTEEDYIKAIQTSIKGPKVFLKRKLSEIRINPYMKSLLTAWKANHDIQFVVDPYACAVYITNYISKSAKGMSTLLYNACKEARKGNDDIRRQVRFIGNQFLNATEICAQEAVYLALQLPLIKKTREVIFINTSPPEDRARLLKSTEQLEELPENSKDIYSSNRIVRYAMRPKQLEHWCLADYVSELNITYPASFDFTKPPPYADNHDDDDIGTDNAVSVDSDGKEISHSIDITLPNGIKIKSRQNPRVIRYVRYSEKVDRENYCREQLLLFLPWRNETEDLLDHGRYDNYSAHYDKKKQHIQIARQKYDFKCKDLEIAIERAESDTLADDIENAMQHIAPNNVQHECDDELIGRTESSSFEFFNPIRTVQQQNYDIGQDIGVPSRVSDDLLKSCMSDTEYLKLLRKLNIKQREFLLHVTHWVKTRTEPLRIFLTGGAGVGKSVVIKAVHQALHRYYISQDIDDLDHLRVLKCAPTGTAAYNIEGTTLHHAFAIPVQQNFTKLSPEKDNTLLNKYKHLKFVIIDEVSLVSNELFRRIDQRCRQIMRNDSPFGGLHVLLVGDLFQLEPVYYTWVYNNLVSGHRALATNQWKEYFVMYELTEIMRQKGDQTFAHLLNILREENHTQDDIKKLQRRIISATDENYPHTAPHMFTTNNEVSSFNESVYNSTTTQKAIIQAVSTVIGDVTDEVKDVTLRHLNHDKKYTSHMQTGGLAKQLRVAVDLHYDCTVNLDVEDGLTNGATCVLKKIEYKQGLSKPAILWVKFIDNKIGQNWRQKYQSFYTSNIKKSFTPIFAITRTFPVNRAYVTRQQFPLCPSSARTMHKCQGYTLPKAVIHMGTRKISQSHYTAFSRVTNLKNLHILHFNESKIAVYPSTKEEMHRLRTECQLECCYTPVYEMPQHKHKVIFQNIRSLHKHFQDIAPDSNYLNADVIGIAESRLMNSDHTDTYALPGFHSVIRNDQQQTTTTRPPHGLAVYVQKTYTVISTHHFSSNDIEYSFVNVKSNDNRLLQIVFVYKSQSCSVSTLRENVHTISSLIDPTHSFLIIGDFNINAATPENRSLIECLETTFNSPQLISEKTTVYNTIIDLAFSNVNCTVGTIDSVISDHKVITAQI
ncbi:uncharacterized protein [Ptychodera flava]|uniref:uncharacterized protein n=1 Tax=Ptychodera flava TaxID=63121 RepID=UPI00396A8909